MATFSLSKTPKMTLKMPNSNRVMVKRREAKVKMARKIKKEVDAKSSDLFDKCISLGQINMLLYFNLYNGK